MGGERADILMLLLQGPSHLMSLIFHKTISVRMRGVLMSVGRGVVVMGGVAMVRGVRLGQHGVLTE